MDNKADTPARRQIIADIFGNCVSTGDYKPLLIKIKKSDSEETKCYRVHDEWLFAFYPQYHTLM